LLDEPLGQGFDVIVCGVAANGGGRGVEPDAIVARHRLAFEVKVDDGGQVGALGGKGQGALAEAPQAGRYSDAA